MGRVLRGRGRLSRALLLASLLFGASGPTSAAVISAGTPTTTVPTYLSDGSYLFPPGIAVTLGTNQFLLPVEISGALNLQMWTFDLLFDNSVVAQVDPDPFNIDHGIYGARFTSDDPDSLSFILGGFPFNPLGRIDGLSGQFPSLIPGASGDGILAYVLFESLQDGEPNFRIENASTVQVPEPSTPALLAALALILLFTRRRAARI